MINDELKLSLRLLEARTKLIAGNDIEASTNRLRLAGRICCNCNKPFWRPSVLGERRCKRCGPAQTHPVYLSFFFQGEWVCHFMEKDMKTSLPRVLHFRDSGKILEITQRGYGALEPEDRKAFERAIEIGHGGVWLALSEVQYNTLRDCNPTNRETAQAAGQSR